MLEFKKDELVNAQVNAIAKVIINLFVELMEEIIHLNVWLDAMVLKSLINFTV